ncbi:MAG: AAA family ATPase [Leptospiraceae bacterium]|nr:AAA family ATPase [Leptospiraceae bacterium]
MGSAKVRIDNYFSNYTCSEINESKTGVETLNTIRAWYNGYRLSEGISVYNPFSTLLVI